MIGIGRKTNDMKGKCADVAMKTIGIGMIVSGEKISNTNVMVGISTEINNGGKIKLI